MAESDQASRSKRVPVSTYRLQFNGSFTFRDAERIVAYLSELGITDCYCSPYLKARPGSMHGYDICDHGTLNPELGTEQDYEGFVRALKMRRMGQILDVVPNHMSIWETANALWMDVLENGPSSPYARFFDIDWHPLRGDTDLENRLLLPILGRSYGEALEGQELSLTYEEGSFFLAYFEHRLPLDPSSYSEVLQGVAEGMNQTLGPEHVFAQEMQSILTSIGHLPARPTSDPQLVLERQREKEVVKRRLRVLCEGCEVAREALDGAVALFNGQQGDPQSFDRLDALLNRQAYRLADWRVAAEEINYRRFFNVNDLAALRTGDPAVFQHIHQLVLQLVQQGKVTGLRVDHPDGLWDPVQYFARLQGVYQSQGEGHPPAGSSGADAGEGGSAGDGSPTLGSGDSLVVDSLRPTSLYVVAEKILRGEERLPRDWAVDGTTGYDFAQDVNGLFVDPAARGAFDAVYRGFTGREERFEELLISSKKMIMARALSSEINMLSHQLKRIASGSRRYRDFTLTGIALALQEVIACLPIYRTYIREGTVEPRDQEYVENAVREAGKRRRANHPIFDFLRDLLLLRWPEKPGEGRHDEVMSFVYKFQQVTGPVMAKALEDTVYYRYNRLISLNEVGGDPDRFGVPVSVFHRRNLERLDQWPHSLLATSTHDTKRSEDVRARIDVLSEMPQEWKSALYRWNRLNRRHRGSIDGEPVPDRNEEYYIYQTLLGTWPLGSLSAEQHEAFVGRMVAHMLKVLREAKTNSSWDNPDGEYEEQALSFLTAILDRGADNPFLADFQLFQRKVAHYGLWNSLSQTLVKIASPGVPDFYQGTEIWDFSLVDPDNRWPVDYAPRIGILRSLRRKLANPRCDRARLARELVETRDDGRIKMYLIQTALAHRRSHRLLFQEGSYLPIEARGRQRENICAFARTRDDEVVVVVMPRLVVGLTRGERVPPMGVEVWGDASLLLPREMDRGPYRNLFTGEEVRVTTTEGSAALPLAELFGSFPVALLERAG